VAHQPGRYTGENDLAAHPAYPRDEVARLVIVPGKIANIVLR
jgi:hypothetical protein